MSGAHHSRSALPDLHAAAILFLVVFLVYCISPNATPFDSRWTVHTAMSILNEGDTDLDEYLPLLEADRFYMIECTESAAGWRLVHRRDECPDGRLRHFYPVAVAILAVPPVAAMRAAVSAAQPLLRPLAERSSSPVVRSLLAGDFIGASAAVELIVASIFVALAAALLYFVAREFLDRPAALLAAGLFAFGTPAWSLASRGLWQHGPSMTLLALALLMALRGRRNARWIALMGAPLALAFFVRATNAVAAAVFTVYVFRRHRRRLPVFLLSAAAVTALFAAYNLAVYDFPLAPYSWVQRAGAPGLSLHPRFLEALAGNLISPGRGLFVYVPAALFSLYGMAVRPAQEAARELRPYLMAIVALHWLLVSSFEDWIGGHGFGPRYMSDVSPILIYFLIPAFERIREMPRRRALAAASLFALLAAAGVAIHFRGAARWSCWEWNTAPVDINRSQWRVWDWRDPAFLR